MFQSKPARDISSNKLFNGIDFAGLGLSNSSKDFRKIREGEIIFEAGDASDSLFLIVEGEIKLKLPEKTGASFVINRSVNDFFGEKEFITRSSRNSSAVAVKDAILYKISFDTLALLTSANTKIKNNLKNFTSKDDYFFENPAGSYDASGDYSDEYLEIERIKTEIENDLKSNNFGSEDIDFTFEDTERAFDKSSETNSETDKENVQNTIEKQKTLNKQVEGMEMTEQNETNDNYSPENEIVSVNVPSSKKIMKFVLENARYSKDISEKYLNILLKEDLPEEMKTILSEIVRQNNLNLVNMESVLNFLEDKNNLESKTISLNQALDDILEKLSEYCEARNVELYKKIGSDGSVNLDKNNFYQACFQIVKNSCDASNGLGKVYITSIKNDNEILLTFEDNGIGIPENVKDSIFEPYFSHGKSGSGLGLALSKKIIKDHGGKINAESILGERTTVTISLPLVK